MVDRSLHSFLMVALMCVLAMAAEGQDRHDWQSLAHLQAGDRIRLSLKTGPVEGAFQNWTPQQVTAGTVTATKEDVLKIERYRQGGWGRGKTAGPWSNLSIATGAAK